MIDQNMKRLINFLKYVFSESNFGNYYNWNRNLF